MRMFQPFLIILLLGLLGSLGLFSEQSAHAQPVPDYKQDNFYKESLKDTASSFNNIASPALMQFGGAEFLFGDASPGLSDENMRCDEGGAGPNGGDCSSTLFGSDYQALDVRGAGSRGGEKKHRINVYSAPRAVMGTLNSAAHKSMIDLGLVSTVATTLSAIELVEPAIARGLEASLNFANDTVGIDYASDSNFQARMDASPGIAELVGETRTDCIGNLMEDNTSMVWTEARVICDGNTDFTNATITNDDFRNGQANFGVFKLKHNMSHHAEAGGQILPVGGPDSDDYLSLWGYLLRQDSVNLPSAMDFSIRRNTTNTLNASTIEATLKLEVDNLNRLLGNVLFKISDKDGTTTLPESTRMISTTLIPPHIPVANLTPSTVLKYAGPKWYIHHLEKEIYEDIWKLMESYCKDYIRFEPPNPYTYSDPENITDSRYYWARQDAIQKLFEISSPAISMTGTMMELLIYFVALEDTTILNPNLMSGSTFVGYDCSTLDTAVAANNISWESLHSSPSAAVTNATGGLDLNLVSLRRTVVFTLAHRIAADTVWSMIGKVRKRLSRLSGGAFNDAMMAHADNLIDRMAQTDYMKNNGAKGNLERAEGMFSMLRAVRAADNTGNLFSILAGLSRDRANGGMPSGIGNNAS